MADLTYMVVFGFSSYGKIISQATTLVHPDTDQDAEYQVLSEIVSDGLDIAFMRSAVMESSSYGDEKTADGKDKYRVHRLRP